MRIDTLYYTDGWNAKVEVLWRCDSPIRPDEDIHGENYSIYIDGTIEARSDFLYDFASGAVDTDAMKVAALAHDIPCRAIRQGLLDPSWQPVADRLLQTVYLRVDVGDLGWFKSSVRKIRAKWVFRAVREYQKRKPRILFESHPVKRIPAEKKDK